MLRHASHSFNPSSCLESPLNSTKDKPGKCILLKLERILMCFDSPFLQKMPIVFLQPLFNRTSVGNTNPLIFHGDREKTNKKKKKGAFLR
ncbi:hypothetical protein QG37_02870 [Candidozyma auris]|nr:hypothetical protein QG37_02870 [[Candida] auris]